MIVVSAAKLRHQNYQTKHSSIALYVPMEYQPAIDNCTHSIVFIHRQQPKLLSAKSTRHHLILQNKSTLTTLKAEHWLAPMSYTICSDLHRSSTIGQFCPKQVAWFWVSNSLTGHRYRPKPLQPVMRPNPSNERYHILTVNSAKIITASSWRNWLFVDPPSHKTK